LLSSAEQGCGPPFLLDFLLPSSTCLLNVCQSNLVTLRKISPYEKDFTETDRQRGILLKSLFVMAFNWTIPLTVTNVANENNNIYNANGYVIEVFWIALF
jgi:hypothetical protein